MKTVTMWNVPLDLAELVVKTMREKVAQMLQEGANSKEVIDLMWQIQNWEDAIQEERNA